MLRLRNIDTKNVWKLVKLRVREDQADFVAPNGMSIIEAYATISEGGYALPMGIYDGETPVGFLMIGYDPPDPEAPFAFLRGGAYSVWRFMIDRDHQHRGYGRQAMALALDFIRSLPFGPAENCFLSYEPENERAKALYASFGFMENGEKDETELIAVLKL